MEQRRKRENARERERERERERVREREREQKQRHVYSACNQSSLYSKPQTRESRWSGKYHSITLLICLFC